MSEQITDKELTITIFNGVLNETFTGRANFDQNDEHFKIEYGVAGRGIFNPLISNGSSFDIQFVQESPDFSKIFTFLDCKVIAYDNQFCTCLRRRAFPQIVNTTKFRNRIYTTEVQRETAYITLLGLPYLVGLFQNKSNFLITSSFIILLIAAVARIINSAALQDYTFTEGTSLKYFNDDKFKTGFLARTQVLNWIVKNFSWFILISFLLLIASLINWSWAYQTTLLFIK